MSYDKKKSIISRQMLNSHNRVLAFELLRWKT